MKKLAIILIMFFIVFSTGCQAVDVNDTSLPIGIGLDLVDDDQFKVSVQLAKPRAAEEGAGNDDEADFVVVSETGETLSMASRNLMLTQTKVPLWTYTNVVVLGENLVSKDPAFYADMLARNPNIRNNAMLVVSKDISPEDLLEIDTPLEPFSALGITKILKIQETSLGIYVPVNIGDFIQKIATPGVDLLIPIVTVIKKGDKELLKIDGAAVFAENKMLGHFNEKECRGYRLLNAGVQTGGLISIPSPGDPGKFIAIELLRSKTKIRPHIDQKGNISMSIKVEGEGNFYEQQTEKELLTLKTFPHLEKLIAQEIEKDIALSIIRAQALNSDVFGWGQLVRSSYPKVWSEIEANWYDYFPDIKTNIEVDFSLRRSYLIDKTVQFR
ncbi:MAG TPA: Ger(x)C family spore germination protein [Syntrophomonadaceae bacterium]|nr:Ger(x)C family spore germination protein [Syntrophomonadaceae bacterium]